MLLLMIEHQPGCKLTAAMAMLASSKQQLSTGLDVAEEQGLVIFTIIAMIDGITKQHDQHVRRPRR